MGRLGFSVESFTIIGMSGMGKLVSLPPLADRSYSMNLRTKGDVSPLRIK